STRGGSQQFHQGFPEAPRRGPLEDQTDIPPTLQDGPRVSGRGNPIPTTMTDLAYKAGICAARRLMISGVTLASLAFAAAPAQAGQGSYASANFVVTAASDAVARGIASAAEESRTRFTAEWLDRELPDWKTPVRIVVHERGHGGDGSVTYERYRGAIENVRITVRGPLDRILEYVLPHEVAHVILALSFRQPLPRWLDEGVAMLSESQSQR